MFGPVVAEMPRVVSRIGFPPTGAENDVPIGW